MNYTPGPWTANDFPTELPTHTVLYVHAGSEHICQCWLTGCDRGLDNHERLCEMHANARLIAAAPLLLEALRYVMVNAVWLGKNDDMYEIDGSALAKARAAIKAAGG